MVRVRNLKVWFPLRRGLARELVGGASLWVRALDGVSFDVRRGEVFCLVGESGCGKTTTGKALLRLVDATEGDIFLEMPEKDYQDYGASVSGPDTPESKAKTDRLRRKFSLTWTETIPWTMQQALLLLAFVAAGFAVGLLAGIGLSLLYASPFSDGGYVLLASILTGIGLGVVGCCPPSRPYGRTPVILALLAVFEVNLLPMAVFTVNPGAFLGQATDILGALGAAWGVGTLPMILAIMIAPSVAGGAGRVILSTRKEREGLQGIQMRTLRRRLHLIFQDPYESLNPKQSVFEIVSEPLIVNHIASDPQEISALVSRSLEDAGLRPAEEFMFRFPHELSGGQRQRVSIAAALALEPDFIVADEPVSMLDVSIRTEILQLMMDLRKTRRLTYLFITHDLSLAWILADRIAVMYLGKIVEEGTADDVVAHPKHPYTRALISVVPSPDPRHKVTRQILRCERPDPLDIPTGCRFHPRCPMAFAKCGWNAGELKEELEEILPSMPAVPAGAITLVDPHRLKVATRGTSAQHLADALQALAKEKRDERLVFRGIADIAPGTDGVVVTMHPWEEPALVEVAPGNSVACYLVTPPAQAKPAVEVAP